MHFASLSTTNAQLEMHERETVTEEMNTLLQEAVVWQTTVWILIPQNSHTWRSEQNKWWWRPCKWASHPIVTISITYYIGRVIASYVTFEFCINYERDVGTVKVDDDVSDEHVLSSDKCLSISAVHYTSCLNRRRRPILATPVYTSAT